MKFGILVDFQNLQAVNQIFKMVVSVALAELSSYFISFFYEVYSPLIKYTEALEGFLGIHGYWPKT